jgi:hypothetical protein
MTSSDPAVQRSLASDTCAPTHLPRGLFCHLSPICSRCHRCVGHCTCPPPEQRYKSKQKAAK